MCTNVCEFVLPWGCVMIMLMFRFSVVFISISHFWLLLFCPFQFYLNDLNGLVFFLVVCKSLLIKGYTQIWAQSERIYSNTYLKLFTFGRVIRIFFWIPLINRLYIDSIIRITFKPKTFKLEHWIRFDHCLRLVINIFTSGTDIVHSDKIMSIIFTLTPLAIFINSSI